MYVYTHIYIYKQKHMNNYMKNSACVDKKQINKYIYICMYMYIHTCT